MTENMIRNCIYLYIFDNIYRQYSALSTLAFTHTFTVCSDEFKGAARDNTLVFHSVIWNLIEKHVNLRLPHLKAITHIV